MVDERAVHRCAAERAVRLENWVDGKGNGWGTRTRRGHLRQLHPGQHLPAQSWRRARQKRDRHGEVNGSGTASFDNRRPLRKAQHGKSHRLIVSNHPRALAPLRLTKITLARIGPSAPIAIKDFAQFVEHFCSNPKTPAGESFAGGSCGAFLFPSCAHCGNFQQVQVFNLCFRHSRIVTSDFLKTPCKDL